MNAVNLNQAKTPEARKNTAPVVGLQPLKASDFAKAGVPFGLALERALEPLSANDLAAAAFHSGVGRSPLEPLTKLDFIPGTREAASHQTRHEQITEQAQKWVAQTFFGTLLKQMRNSPFKSELFSGGRGGEVFGSLFDQEIADRMASAAGSKLVRSVVRQLEANQAYTNASSSAAPAQQRPAVEKQEMDEASNPFRNVRIHVAPNLRA